MCTIEEPIKVTYSKCIDECFIIQSFRFSLQRKLVKIVVKLEIQGFSRTSAMKTLKRSNQTVVFHYQKYGRKKLFALTAVKHGPRDVLWDTIPLHKERSVLESKGYLF